MSVLDVLDKTDDSTSTGSENNVGDSFKFVWWDLQLVVGSLARLGLKTRLGPGFLRFRLGRILGEATCLQKHKPLAWLGLGSGFDTVSEHIIGLRATPLARLIPWRTPG